MLMHFFPRIVSTAFIGLLIFNPLLAHDKWSKMSLEEAGFDSYWFQDAVDYTFAQKKYDRETFETDGLLIIKDGKIVFEKYANGFHKSKQHMLWSFSKGLVNGILGVAEKQGVLSRQTRVSDYFKSLDTEKGRKIQLKHLMQMTSGIDFYEENPVDIIFSDSIYINYSWKGYQNMAEFTADLGVKQEPGTKFKYSTGDANLAMGLLKRIFHERSNSDHRAQYEYNQFPWENLFYKIGMTNTTIEQDGSGTFIGGSFGWSTPRDMAKFAMLYLNDGKWDFNNNGRLEENENLFPKDWVDFSVRQVSPPLTAKNLKEKDQLRLNREAYGAFWWLNKKLPMNSQRPYPNLPEDAYLALGYRGQTLAVLPQENMVIIRFGSDELGHKIDRAKFFYKIMESYAHWSSENPVPMKAKKAEKKSFNFLKFTNELLKTIDGDFRSDDGFALSPAKDLCSCLYVANQPLDYCMENHEQYKMFIDLGLAQPPKVNRDEKSVTIRNSAGLDFISTHTAKTRFVSPKLGCMVEEFHTPFRIFGSCVQRPEAGYFEKDEKKCEQPPTYPESQHGR